LEHDCDQFAAWDQYLAAIERLKSRPGGRSSRANRSDRWQEQVIDEILIAIFNALACAAGGRVHACQDADDFGRLAQTLHLSF